MIDAKVAARQRKAVRRLRRTSIFAPSEPRPPAAPVPEEVVLRLTPRQGYDLREELIHIALTPERYKSVRAIIRMLDERLLPR